MTAGREKGLATNFANEHEFFSISFVVKALAKVHSVELNKNLASKSALFLIRVFSRVFAASSFLICAHLRNPAAKAFSAPVPDLQSGRRGVPGRWRGAAG